MWQKLAAGAGILALAAFFGWLYGHAQYHAGQLDERDKWRVEQLKAEKSIGAQLLEQQRQFTAAYAGLAQRTADREPIILRSTNTVREYAQTQAGAALCLGAERVLGIDALDRELFGESAAPPAGGSAEALHTDAGAAPGQR